MKQYQFEYQSIGQLKRELDKVNVWRRRGLTSHMLFQIFTDTLNRDQIDVVCDVITQVIPDALYMGCSTNGNIVEGGYGKSSISISCTMFEYPTSKLELLQYILTEDTAEDVVQALKDEIKARPWVKAVEMFMTIRGMSMTSFCEAFCDIDPAIQVFGGGAFNSDLNNDEACVFSKMRGYSEKGVVFLLMGGDDLHVSSTFVTGWKPLGREFLVTKANGRVLCELDGIPAYEAYNKYLNIPKNEHFFYNTLEFPFFYKHNGISILRAPTSCNDDGSLNMTSDIDENVKARIAYGDPWTILDCVRREGVNVAKFQPEVIKVFSCAARRTFWGVDEVGKETEPFQSIAPTSGFYTSGEFLRTGVNVNQHNVTLVVAGLREGEAHDDAEFSMNLAPFSGKVSMISRLATFIDAATKELNEANLKLSMAAKVDALSGLYNRGEIQRRVQECVASDDGPHTLIMLDIDNFKHVNDTFGHQEGDAVIVALARTMTEVLEWNDASTGRWGGEEFMILLPSTKKSAGVDIAENIRRKFNEIVFEKAGQCSASIGVAEILAGENAFDACARVDQALYKAKQNGKNQVFAL